MEKYDAKVLLGVFANLANIAALLMWREYLVLTGGLACAGIIVLLIYGVIKFLRVIKTQRGFSLIFSIGAITLILGVTITLVKGLFNVVTPDVLEIFLGMGEVLAIGTLTLKYLEVI